MRFFDYFQITSNFVLFIALFVQMRINVRVRRQLSYQSLMTGNAMYAVYGKFRAPYAKTYVNEEGPTVNEICFNCGRVKHDGACQE